MKTPQLKQFFKATALALCISSAAPAFAQTVDQVVAVVDNSVILQSDLAQTAAEMQQQLQAQNNTLRIYQLSPASARGRMNSSYPVRQRQAPQALLSYLQGLHLS